jgi:hypothetical protein
MPEKTSDILRRLSDILHWFGKYHEANELALLSVIMANMKDAGELSDLITELALKAMPINKKVKK